MGFWVLHSLYLAPLVIIISCWDVKSKQRGIGRVFVCIHIMIRKGGEKKNPSRLWQPGDQFKVEFEWQKVEKKYINSMKMLRVVIKSLIMSAAYYQYLPTAPVWFIIHTFFVAIYNIVYQFLFGKFKEFIWRITVISEVFYEILRWARS